MNDSLEAFIFYAYDFKESSRMLDAFSLERGRISLVAKGAKRNKSPLLNLSVPFVHANLQIIEGRTSNYLKEGSIISAHLALRKSIRKMQTAFFVVEVLSKSLFENQIEETIFHMLIRFFDLLEDIEEEKIPSLLAAFLLKTVSFLGFRPILTRCIQCDRSIMDEALLFDLEAGGMSHPSHGKRNYSYLLNEEEYKKLCNLITMSLKEIVDLKTKALDRKLLSMVLNYYRLHTGQYYFKTEEMMKKLSLL